MHVSLLPFMFFCSPTECISTPSIVMRIFIVVMRLSISGVLPLISCELQLLSF